MLLRIADGNVLEILGPYRPAESKFNIDMIAPIPGRFPLQKRHQAHSVEMVVFRQLRSRQVVCGSGDIDTLDQGVTLNPALHHSRPAHHEGDAGTVDIEQGCLLPGTVVAGENDEGILVNSQFLQLVQDGRHAGIDPCVASMSAVGIQAAPLQPGKYLPPRRHALREDFLVQHAGSRIQWLTHPSTP